MNKYITLTLLLLVGLLANAQNDKRLKGVEKEMNALLQTAKAAGFSVAVVHKDKVVYSAGFGYRDYEKKLPADANTLYAIGSSTKAFTSAVLGLLRADGKLAFSDSPLKYVPELHFYNNDLNGNVNIEDLMSHRTGIPRHDYSWYLFPTHNRDSLIQRIKYQEPFTGLRQQWHYNNFMFAVQGTIAEKITGKTWEDNIRERFLAPLGMDRTNVSIAEMKSAANAAFGYSLKKDVITKTDYYDIAAMAPAGAINSSVNDISKWLIMWIGKGKFDGKEILPADYVNEAMSAQAVIHGGLPSKQFPNTFMASYGYGWMMSSYKGHYRVEHGGNIDGFSASVAFFPAEDVGIVVLANQDGSSLPSLVRNTLADRMLGAKKTDWNKELEKGMKEEKEAEEEAKKSMRKEEEAVSKLPSHPLDDYTGLFSNPGYGTFEIIKTGDSLFAEFRQTRFYLKHKHYDIFAPYEAKDGIDASQDSDGLFFNFSTNDGGDISGVKLKVEQSLDHPLEFKRSPKAVAVAGDILMEYAGNYEIAGMTVKVSVKEGKLYMFVPGQPEYELSPVSKTMYVITTLDGYKAEFVNENGKVKELVLHQPNGKFTAVKK
ncbi:serine hydrolase [uncultured Flavobacterium sp.]|uniref:serine hydrolase n=1 Tax=uncultured Flavobacterium sp. TaxID=165435 RepID=UPI0025F64542|nr:serine hydrolase [uncultured Flavobacterium sp.]